METHFRRVIGFISPTGSHQGWIPLQPVETSTSEEQFITTIIEWDQILATGTHCSLFWSGLDKCQVPIKPALSLPSSTGQGRGDQMQGLRVEVRTGADHSLITITDKAD